MTDSKLPEVLAARAQLEQILQNLPSAENFPGLIPPEANARKAKRAARKAENGP